MTTKNEFTSERQMRNYIANNLHLLEPGLMEVKSPTKTDEYPCCVDGHAAKGGSIDVLALDRRRDYVVIEVKHKDARADTIGQLLGYIGWIRRHLRPLGPVRGIVVARRVSPLLLWAIQVVRDVRFAVYLCPRPGELHRVA